MLGVAVQPRELVRDPVEPLEHGLELAVRHLSGVHGVNLARAVGQKLASAAHDGDAGPKPLERARAGLDRVDATRGAELGERDTCELGGRVGENRKLHSFGLQSSKRGAHFRGGPEVDRRRSSA